MFKTVLFPSPSLLPPERKGKKESDFFSSLLYSWNPSCLDFLLALCLIRKTRWPPSPTGNKGVHTQFLHSFPTPAVFPLCFLSFFLTVLKSSQMSNYLGKKVVEEHRSTRLWCHSVRTCDLTVAQGERSHAKPEKWRKPRSVGRPVSVSTQVTALPLPCRWSCR